MIIIVSLKTPGPIKCTGISFLIELGPRLTDVLSETIVVFVMRLIAPLGMSMS